MLAQWLSYRALLKIDSLSAEHSEYVGFGVRFGVRGSGTVGEKQHTLIGTYKAAVLLKFLPPAQYGIDEEAIELATELHGMDELLTWFKDNTWVGSLVHNLQENPPAFPASLHPVLLTAQSSVITQLKAIPMNDVSFLISQLTTLKHYKVPNYVV